MPALACPYGNPRFAPASATAPVRQPFNKLKQQTVAF